MVLGAGGYRNLDFVKFGGPMQIWMLVITSVILVSPHCSKLPPTGLLYAQPSWGSSTSW